MQQEDRLLDIRLAAECAAAFSVSTGLGCTVSGRDGEILHETGYGCASCRLCGAAGANGGDMCARSHIYGMAEAQRFGGKYIYFCPLGLTCFVSPIVGGQEASAKITVGPFLMVEREDYVACDLEDIHGLTGSRLAAVIQELDKVPFVQPVKVDSLSTLLFMAVGFMNNVSAANSMLRTQGIGAVQGQVSSYILQFKAQEKTPPYPFETERLLLRAVAHKDKPEAQRLLNELFGYILFSAGGDFDRAKTRVYELLVLISRTAVEAGADPDATLDTSHRYLQSLPAAQDMEQLCLWLIDVMDYYMDSVFQFSGEKHAHLIHKTLQYLNSHYAEKVTMEQMAGMVYLSPAYFSRVFKRQTGDTFNSYLNRLRIEKSKDLLRHPGLRLTDIALLVGFEDQSYFTKVFKRFTGQSPMKYRDTNGFGKAI